MRWGKYFAVQAHKHVTDIVIMLHYKATIFAVNAMVYGEGSVAAVTEFGEFWVL